MKLSKFLKICGVKNLTVTIINYSGYQALGAVKRNGEALQYVKEQTESVCLEAVKQDGEALQYVDKRLFEDDLGHAKKK